MTTKVTTLRIGRITHALEPLQGEMDFVHIQGISTADALTHTPDATIGEILESGSRADMPHSFVLEMDDPWSQTVDMNQAKSIILSFNVMPKQIAGFSQPQQLEWPMEHSLSSITDSDLAPAFNKLDEETAEFVVDHELTASVAWLQNVTPHFFEGSDFEISLLPDEDVEDTLLALEVFGAFNPSEFRSRMHRLCEAMLAEDHRNLYEFISIFQRRVASNGWKTIPWYSAFSAV